MNLEAAREVFQSAGSILITAGAGMGVDSGLPDFRGKERFWNAYPAARKYGAAFSDMANPQWFVRDPGVAWAFYGHRLNLYRKTNPHEGFGLLLDFANSLPGKYFVFTSNVDGHFQKSGFDEDRIVEIHGSIHHYQCSVPCDPYIRSSDDLHVDVNMDEFRALDPLPRCPECNQILRPNILMFGDWSWVSYRTDSQQERLERWLFEQIQSGRPPVIVEIGAGQAVPTVRHFSETVMRRTGAVFFRINPRDYGVPSGKTFGFPVGALEGIRSLMNL